MKKNSEKINALAVCVNDAFGNIDTALDVFLYNKRLGVLDDKEQGLPIIELVDDEVCKNIHQIRHFILMFARYTDNRGPLNKLILTFYEKVYKKLSYTLSNITTAEEIYELMDSWNDNRYEIISLMSDVEEDCKREEEAQARIEKKEMEKERNKYETLS